MTALVIAGMQRSGTSFIADVVSRLGVDLGANLMAGDGRNPHGFYQDVDIVTIQSEVLRSACEEVPGGCPDWGWMPSGSLDRTALEASLPRLHSYAARRQRETTAAVWGFKDPRSTMLLDCWAEVLGPDARYLLVYRSPEQVVASLARQGIPVEGWGVWAFSTRNLLAFQADHPGQVALVDVAGVVADPAAFLTVLRERLGLDLPSRSAERAQDRLLEARLAVARALDTSLGGFDGSRVEDPGAPAWAPELASKVQAVSDLLGPTDQSPAAVAQRALEGLGAWSAPTPRVAVVIPTHDRGRMLADAVASVQAFGSGNAELVVVDDRSSDPVALAVLAGLRERGFRVIASAWPGVGSARNAGILATKAPYVVFLDDDDLLRGGYFEEAPAILDARPEIGVVHGYAEFFGIRRGPWVVSSVRASSLLTWNSVAVSALVRRSILERVGGFDEVPTGIEDWDLWLSVLECGSGFHLLERTCFEYRVNEGSMLRRISQSQLKLTLRHLIARHRGLYARMLDDVVPQLMTDAGYLEREAPGGTDNAENARLRAELRSAKEQLTDAIRQISDGMAAAKRQQEIIEQLGTQTTSLARSGERGR